ncbi:MAG: diacylglycerol kinase family lipid kinase [Nitrospirae bacterium]|nr:MAG: diacylglycerol kinase family lipid kinase [Nitrospirota bacterium]
MKQEIIIIGNPIAGRGAAGRIAKAVEILKSREFNVRLMLTNKQGDAELFSRDISQNSENPPLPPFAKGGRGGILIIAAGGDGTFNEVINGIAGSDIPMAILPLGTTNVLAKELGIPENVEKAVDIALSGKIQTVALGRITLSQTTNNKLSRYFLLMAGIGFDGETVYRTENRIKRYSGKGAYVWSGLNTLLSWNPGELTFNMDGKLCKGYSAIICNASKYAGNFKVAPDAKISEPSLYVFVMQGKKRMNLVRYVSGIISGRHLKFCDITYQKAKRIEISGNAHIQIDGDYLGKTPAAIEIVPDTLRMIY